MYKSVSFISSSMESSIPLMPTLNASYQLFIDFSESLNGLFSGVRDNFSVIETVAI